MFKKTPNDQKTQNNIHNQKNKMKQQKTQNKQKKIKLEMYNANYLDILVYSEGPRQTD